MTINTSGITPVGVSILVYPEQVEETSESGIVLSSLSQLERDQMKQTDGIVIAIGPNAYYDEKGPRCKVGDKIIMAAYAGMIRKGNDGLQYRVIKDNDVVAILEKE